MRDVVDRIIVRRNGQTVEVSVAVCAWYQGAPRLPFMLACNSEAVAECVVNQTNDELRDFVAEARRQAYNEGYSDGRKKVGKQNRFHRTLRLVTNVGWREAR